MKISGIYQILSIKKPERIYIGSAVNMKKRWEKHLADLRNNRHHSIKLQKHCSKYKSDDLIFIILEPCLPEFLITREQHYLDEMKPWFNIATIAGSPMMGRNHSIKSKEKIGKASRGNKYCLGLIHSDETKKKMSEASLLRGCVPPSKLGTHQSEEHKKKLSKAHEGRKFTEDHKRKLSEVKMGKKRNPFSEETKKKISISHLGNKYALGYKHSDETRVKMSAAKKGNSWNKGRKWHKGIKNLIEQKQAS